MSNQCTPDIEALTAELGFSCQNSPAVLRLSNPFELANWTLPVIELLIVAGAVLALWWAVRRLRRDGDPVNLMLWSATVLYLLIVEPPLYFPTAFGVEELIGAVFSHNIFTVQFLYDRLPLYIIALYPAMAMLAYEIVRSLGVFRDRGIVVGAICVGFVHQCFYEVFDQLGPALQWWTWNRDTAINQPMLASVPMASVLLFATVGPAVLTALVLLFVGPAGATGRRFGPPGLALRTVAVAVLVPVSMTILNIPIALADRGDPAGMLRWATYAVYLVLFAAIALSALLPRLRRAGGPDVPNPFVRMFGPAYLLVLTVLWIAALLGTGDGPTGNVWYTAVCFAIAAVVTVSVSVRRDRRPAVPEREEVVR